MTRNVHTARFYPNQRKTSLLARNSLLSLRHLLVVKAAG